MSAHTITALNGAGSTTPRAVAGYEAISEGRTVVHDLLDGSIGVSLVAPRPRSGTLVLVYEDRAEAFAARTLHTALSRFSYVNAEVPEVSTTYVLDGRLRIAQDDEASGIWYVEVDYLEVPS